MPNNEKPYDRTTNPNIYNSNNGQWTSNGTPFQLENESVSGNLQFLMSNRFICFNSICNKSVMVYLFTLKFVNLNFKIIRRSKSNVQWHEKRSSIKSIRECERDKSTFYNARPHHYPRPFKNETTKLF